jgi:hypothetical protein
MNLIKRRLCILVFSNPNFVRKENYCLVQYLSDKYGETAQKYALGLKASTYTNVFEWLNPVQEVNRININN